MIVSSRDKITNKSIKKRTEQEDMENMIKNRRLRWLGHMWRMDKDRRANQVLHWVPEAWAETWRRIWGDQKMLNIVYDHFLTRKPPFFTLFIPSRTSDNTTSQNIGGTNAWAVPPPQIFFGGDRPPSPP